MAAVSDQRLDQLSVSAAKFALNLERDGFGIDEVVSALLGAVMALVVMRTENPAAYGALLREYAERLETNAHDL
jgi:hypothetical protein